jgi:hypothetical protein
VRRAWVVMTSASVVCSCLALTSCSTGSETTTLPSATSASTPSMVESVSSSATSSPEDVAVETYRSMWLDMAEAGKTSDYKSPLLARHATGPALSQIVRSLYLDHEAGLASRGEPVLDPKVTSAQLSSSPQKVAVDDCADSSRWLRYKKSGALADDTPGGRRHITATVSGLNGSWKVVNFQVRAVGSC